MRSAGLIYDESGHYIDHLAPFCSLLGWPLLVCEPSIAELARRYYPELEVVLQDPFQLKLPGFTVACDTKPLIYAAFPGQTTTTFWLPHGNSDKGWNSPFFEALEGEDYALVYGPKMVDFLKAKKIDARMIRIGNFRWEYYQRHELFYQKIMPSLSDYFLYAPTWDDAENNNSFWHAFSSLAERLPDEKNLLIKLHPNTLRKYEMEIEVLKGKYGKRKNIHFLTEFPPIYPLLSRCAAYIGDMSSIGYDFLAFDRPLFFLNNKPHLYLSQCGTMIDPKEFHFEAEDHLATQRKKAYAYTFQADKDWKQTIYALCGI